MANTESTVTTPGFSALDAQSRAASAYKSPQSTHTSPVLDSTIPSLTSSSSYASTTVSTLPSPAYGPQHTPLYGPRFGGYTTSATTSPMLLPDPKHPDHEATAALLMLNQQDRRNPSSGRGMSVKDLLSSWNIFVFVKSSPTCPHLEIGAILSGPAAADHCVSLDSWGHAARFAAGKRNMTDQVSCLLCVKEYGIPGVQFGSFRGWKRWVRKGLVVLTPEPGVWS